MAIYPSRIVVVMSPRRDVSMSAQEVRDFLASDRRVGVLTTLGRDGYPHSAAMWFVLDGDVVRMWTYAKSQKAVNLRRDPRAALLVEDGTVYRELRGVLVRGRARITDADDEVAAVGRALFARYEPGPERPAEGTEETIRKQATKRVALSLPLERVASWDHRKL